MLDIGFMEILVIGALALIVVGPKELPGLLRTVGQFMAKARAMARDFQRTMEDAARDADLGDVADVVKKGGKLNKLPFDNQVVNSLKDFGQTVKSEMNAVSRAGEGAMASGSAAQTKTPAPAAAAPKPEAPAPAAAPAPETQPGPGPDTTEKDG
ncbi:Sec-independent protein translocase protein TatB [Pikeienuella sp. HZG-20]|uniref:Sec-independent protein translocase protein TatB n=1 Tax=Paludibacillus litoralis TaxID=3133267 RepID=UPI0030EC0FE9